MDKTIIIYQWQSNSEASAISAMEKGGLRVVLFDKAIKDYHADAAFAQDFLQVLHKEKADAVFSFDYFPIISSICEINHIPYLSWIYDCPLYTLNSKTLINPSNYIFCFDRIYAARLQKIGARHCYHFPLGVSVESFEQIIENASRDTEMNYSCDISFVGNFYNGEKNRLRRAELNDYCKGYVNGVVEAQRKVYGYNFIAEVLQEEIIEEVNEKCELQLGEMYDYSPRQLAADAIGMEVSARERENVLDIAGQIQKVIVYTGSDLPEKVAKNSNILNKGYADNTREMPLIFNASRINLNITSKTIESGIPQRVLDILACGGFCLTNYQPEIAEYFNDGEDLAIYTSEEELQEKLFYYLEHEEERKAIAMRGKEKLKQHFLLENRIEEMLQIANIK